MGGVFDEIVENIQRFVSERDQDDAEVIISVTSSPIRRWVQKLTE